MKVENILYAVGAINDEAVYIGVSPDDLSAEEILDVVNSIP